MAKNQTQLESTEESHRAPFLARCYSCATSLTPSDVVKSSVRLFAYDCLLYHPIRNVSDHLALQKDLQQLEIWAKTWRMRFNAQNCYIMSINSKISHFYQPDNPHTTAGVRKPYLGKTISEDLKWRSHISKTNKKAMSTLGFLRWNLKHGHPYCR